MSESVDVITGSRLHFGLLVSGEPVHRSYGGIGLMIDQPGFTVSVRKAERDAIRASPEITARLMELLPQIRPVGTNTPVEITVTREIPAHAGLGSGTQLGLAVATALSRFAGEEPQPIAELARRAGRGARSWIGTLGFESGGLIAHDCQVDDGSNSPATSRCEFPAEWRFVLVTPGAQSGLSGESERQAFRELPPMSERMLRELSGLQRQLMEAAFAGNFDDFSEQLSEFGMRVGRYFAPIQGGLFADWRMAELARRLWDEQRHGVGQTSWGPTLFAACENLDHAQGVAQFLREYAKWRIVTLDNLEVRIAAPMNRGARIESG